jgi:hypothetical protein
LTPLHPKVKFTVMENPDFDQLLKSYREAVDHWVDAIHAEEALATDDHSMVEMELWDDAGFKLQDAELQSWWLKRRAMPTRMPCAKRITGFRPRKKKAAPFW